MHEDVERWNRRYAEGDGTTEIRAEPELALHLAVVPDSGLALELACGKGANALYLASRGMDVVAADCSLSGLQICQQVAREEKLNLLPLVVDLDCWQIPSSRFDFISVVHYLNRQLFDDIVAALNPGGILFYKTFNRRRLKHNPRFNQRFVLADGELAERFDCLEILAASEPGCSSYLLARK